MNSPPLRMEWEVDLRESTALPYRTVDINPDTIVA